MARGLLTLDIGIRRAVSALLKDERLFASNNGETGIKATVLANKELDKLFIPLAERKANAVKIITEQGGEYGRLYGKAFVDAMNLQIENEAFLLLSGGETVSGFPWPPASGAVHRRSGGTPFPAKGRACCVRLTLTRLTRQFAPF